MQDTADQGGGEFLTAADSGQLAAALKNALGGVIKQTAAVASIATNSTRLSTDTAVYQARFSSQDWSGELLAYPINSDGTMGAQLWNAAAQMPTHNARNIFTWSGSAGISFDYASMNATQKTAMGSSALVDYLRGDSSGEQRNGGSYRDRSTVLGDIVNSDALFVGAQDFGYRMLDDSDEALAYATYLTEKKTRSTTIYVGANDGMLHAFDAASGVEKFAYVPNETIVNENLSLLASTAYTHKYFVDGPAFFGDAYIDTGSGASWKTILAGTTGAGGKSVFALDITDPNSFDASKVLWEFTDPDLGYTVGQPVVAKMADGQWAVVFGNGYNSANQRAFLYIVNLETGALIKKIDTGAGDATQHNGLASPALLDLDGDRTIDRIYAGDFIAFWARDLYNDDSKYRSL
jgi:type IV pilus assembly protein PilY1